MELTSENVEAVVMDCLYEDSATEEDIARAVKVDGIVSKFGFDPKKLAEHEGDIVSMLLQLPEGFRETGKGKGWSFLAACNRADGVQWTGEHRRMEALFCLGLAIGKVKLLTPRAMWNMLPGGVPYYAVLDGPGAA